MLRCARSTVASIISGLALESVLKIFKERPFALWLAPRASNSIVDERNYNVIK